MNNIISNMKARSKLALFTAIAVSAIVIMSLILVTILRDIASDNNDLFIKKLSDSLYDIADKNIQQHEKGEISKQQAKEAFNAHIKASALTYQDIDNLLINRAGILITALLVFIVILLFTGWFIARSISKPLSDMEKDIEDIANGNLSISISYQGRDEAGVLADKINFMVRSFKSTVGAMLESISDVVSAVGVLKTSSLQTTEGAKNQSMQAAQIATAAEEMSQTITDIARNAAVATSSSEEAMSMAEKGKEVADGAVSTVNRVYTSTVELSKMVDKLNNRASEIGEIVTVIKDIADQTNLLALNAAIEAARAGEQGRGFAVVADEVRKLAERTIRATSEITAKIKAVQDESVDTTKSMQQASEEVSQATEFIRQVGESLDHIVSSVQRVKEEITHIATAVDEQAAASEEVTHNIEKTSQIAQQMESMSKDVMGQVDKLYGVTESLKITAAGFNLEGAGQQKGSGEFIQWSDIFSVNIKGIDEQHRELFRLINGLYDAWKANKTRDTIGKLFDGLINYTATHFKTEEDYFQQYGYPETAPHIEAHKALVKQAVELKDKFDRGELNINIEVMNFLKNWLNNHILRTDKRYSSFLNSKGVF